MLKNLLEISRTEQVDVGSSLRNGKSTAVEI
jgi:hypothetical protein